jgi:hypothetical protein
MKPTMSRLPTFAQNWHYRLKTSQHWALTSISAKSVLSTVKEFTLVNCKALDATQSVLTQSKQDFQNIKRLLNSGRRDETLVALAKSRHQELIQAQMQRNFVVGELVDKVNALLTRQQQSLWAAARANGELASESGLPMPGPYRYTPDMTSNQLQILGAATATGSTNDDSLGKGQQALSASQLNQVAIARQNQRIQVAAVASAEAEKLTKSPYPYRVLKPSTQSTRSQELSR